jgi:hypothetical protein
MLVHCLQLCHIRFLCQIISLILFTLKFMNRQYAVMNRWILPNAKCHYYYYYIILYTVLIVSHKKSTPWNSYLSSIAALVTPLFKPNVPTLWISVPMHIDILLVIMKRFFYPACVRIWLPNKFYVEFVLMMNSLLTLLLTLSSSTLHCIPLNGDGLLL